MGSDFYQSSAGRKSSMETGSVPIGIGQNSIIRRAIVDKNARIGNDVKIINKDNVQEANREQQGFYIRSGIVVVLKNAIIPDGTII
jgi:glucose-1-phosphate adenylyltransferase